MLIHIVRYNERLEDILQTYNITFDELRVNNFHITDFKKIPGGVKLKIPFLSKETVQILESTESFVSDYYPSVNKLDEVKEEENSIEIIEEEKYIENSFDNLEKKNEEENLSTNILIKEETINTTSNKNNIIKDNSIRYIRPIYENPSPYYKKSIYPHYVAKKDTDK